MKIKETLGKLFTFIHLFFLGGVSAIMLFGYIRNDYTIMLVYFGMFLSEYIYIKSDEILNMIKELSG